MVAGAAVVVVAIRQGHFRGGPSDRTALRSQHFASDPRWEGFHNHRLGRCTTTRQGLRSQGPDSAGGLITRATRTAALGRPVERDFEHPFSAAGRLVLRGQRAEPFPAGSAIVGFFNAASRDWRPPNLLAFQLNADPVGGGDFSASLAYGARDYETDHVAFGRDHDRPVGLRFGVPYDWRLAYDPAGAAGRGEATLSIPRAGPPVRLALAPTARRAGAALDRFGLSNQTVARGRAVELSLTRLRLDDRPVARVGAWLSQGTPATYRDCLTGQPNWFGWTGPRGRRLGGLVSRTDEDRPSKRAYYADRVGHLSLDDRLHAQGTVQLARANSDSATLLGWFRRGTSGGGSAELAPPDFLGVAITGPSRVGQYFSPLLADTRGHVNPHDDIGVLLNPGSATIRWSLDYFPDRSQSGQIVLRLGRREVRWGLPRRMRTAGAAFNRFGLRNVERGGSFQVAYFDDLRYTVAAHPSESERGSGDRHRRRHGHGHGRGARS